MCSRLIKGQVTWEAPVGTWKYQEFRWACFSNSPAVVPWMSLQLCSTSRARASLLAAGSGLGALCSRAEQVSPLRNFFPSKTACMEIDSLTSPQGLYGQAVKKIATNSWPGVRALQGSFQPGSDCSLPVFLFFCRCFFSPFPSCCSSPWLASSAMAKGPVTLQFPGRAARLHPCSAPLPSTNSALPARLLTVSLGIFQMLL